MPLPAMPLPRYIWAFVPLLPLLRLQLMAVACIIMRQEGGSFEPICR